MAEPKPLREIVNFIKRTDDIFKISGTKAIIQTMQQIKQQAIRNAIRQFIGRNDRPLSGALVNSIFTEFTQSGDEIPSAALGVQNIPYGRIQEFGGVIKPLATNKMQKLWIPQFKNSGRMTPREFINLKRANPGQYTLSVDAGVAGKVVGRGRSRKVIPFFFLADKVKIPARPYLRPAIRAKLSTYPKFFVRFLLQELGKI